MNQLVLKGIEDYVLCPAEELFCGRAPSGSLDGYMAHVKSPANTIWKLLLNLVNCHCSTNKGEI